MIVDERKREGGGLRSGAVLAALATAVAIGSPVRADTKASQKCRSVIASNVTKLVKAGFKAADSCHKAANKACDPGGSCNDVSNPAFDPADKYPAAKTKGTTAIDAACVAGDPVLTNYPGADADGTLYPLLDDAVGGNSTLVLGVTDLDCDKAKVKCLGTIAKGRSSIVNAIVKSSTKCQTGRDKSNTTFGPIDSTCVDAGTDAIAKATLKINKACTGVTGPDVGSCDPLPDCVIDAATTVGQQLARDTYFVAGPPVCGNGAIEGTEQCDDGNTADGDGCNHLCENELGTCTPPASPNAHRLVTVSVNTPQALAGARVDLTYPLFEASIPGSGDSSVVRSHVSILQSGGLSVVNDNDLTRVTVSLASASEFINTGDLFSVNFDNCVALTENICNRTKNVTGCSLAPKRCTCTVAADCGSSGACTNLDGIFECTAGDANRQSCTADPDCATGQTCQLDPKGASNPPLCKPGNFPTLVDNIPPYLVGTEIGPCNGTANGPPGGCPGDNVCLSQTDATACTVADPVDHNGTFVPGVTCAVNIVEMP
jgi:cysteine-rich repeat protein